MRCVVVVAAYRASKWIDACLRSICEQQLPDDWKLELRVGVDGCEETARHLGRGFWYSRENIGPYIIRNSLVGEDPGDALAVFDADDVMLPGYLYRLVTLAGTDGIAGSARADINAEGKRTGGSWHFVSGVCVFSAQAWRSLGGYRPWRVVADHDIIARARALKIPVRMVGRSLYERRRHPDSLTASEAMGVHSRYREELRIRSNVLVSSGDLFVQPETVAMEGR